MRFAVLNNVPPGFCRKMHLLAPGGRLEDLAHLTRDELPQVGLSPTHMEAVESFAEWHRRQISPVLGLVMWYFETIQLDNGGFLRTEDAADPSVGVAIRYLEIAGLVGVTRSQSDSVERAANWLECEIDDAGIIRPPVSDTIDYGTIARTVRSLALVNDASTPTPPMARACETLATVGRDAAAWPTYPDGELSTGATSLALCAMAACPDGFIAKPDARWLAEVQNPDGGWGEFPGSPTRIDNTFWSYRACLDAGQAVEPIDPAVIARSIERPYDTAMAHRLGALIGQSTNSDEVAEWALRSLGDDSDRYAETAVYGLAIAESYQTLTPDQPMFEGLPVRTPEFLRREPPLYDQLADASHRTPWIRFVEHCARNRVAEASIGWFAGVSAAVAIIGDEIIGGLASLPAVMLVAILTFQTLLTVGWLAARSTSRRPLTGVPHFGLAATLGLLLVLLVRNSDEIEVPLLSMVVLTMLLALIIEVIAVATDKADLLNRIGED